MHQQINLLKAFAPVLKPIFPAEKMLTLFGLLLVILFGLYGNLLLVRHKVNKEYQLLVSAQQKQTTILSTLSNRLPNSKTLESVQKEVSKLSHLINKKNDFLVTIDSGNQNQSFTGYLQALSVRTVAGIWLEEIIIDQEKKNFALLGRTVSPNLATLFLSELKKDSAFSEVDFKQLKLEKPKNEELPMAFALRSIPDHNAYIFPEDRVAEKKEAEQNKPNGAKKKTGLLSLIQKAIEQ